jgi:hypothetical protein
VRLRKAGGHLISPLQNDKLNTNLGDFLVKNVHFGYSFNLLIAELLVLQSPSIIYSERQKYGINSLKIKQNFFQKNLWTGQF